MNGFFCPVVPVWGNKWVTKGREPRPPLFFSCYAVNLITTSWLPQDVSGTISDSKTNSLLAEFFKGSNLSGIILILSQAGTMFLKMEWF